MESAHKPKIFPRSSIKPSYPTCELSGSKDQHVLDSQPTLMNPASLRASFKKWIQGAASHRTVFCSGRILPNLEQYIMGAGLALLARRICSVNSKL
jgi:hypothetical protein